MAGIIGAITKEKIDNFVFFNVNNLLVDEYSDSFVFFARQTNAQFLDDKIFKKYNGYFIIYEGTLLNKKSLLMSYSAIDECDLIVKMYQKHGKSFVKELRGNFCGVLYNFAAKKLLIYNNILSLKPLYFYHDKDRFIFGSSVLNIVKILKMLHISYKQSMLGAYYLLTFGYMLEDETVVDEVKRLPPATILEVSHSEKLVLNFYKYYEYNNTTIHRKTAEQMVVELNEVFTNAVKLSFEKDKEYGRKHLALLSGGMDSRMVIFCGKALGYNDIQAVTFSQSHSIDEKIARAIAQFLDIDLFLYQLDGGGYLKQLSDIIKINSGHVFYAGAAHQYSAVRGLNNMIFGQLHNGNLADVMQGDYTDAPFHRAVNVSNWATSRRLLFRIYDFLEPIKSKYANEEHFAINNRGINAITNGNIMSYEFFETAEPYLDFDVVDYASKIPPEYKYKERLFLMMIEKFYPSATKFKWEKWRMHPTLRNLKIYNGLSYKIYMKFYRKFLHLLTPSYSMNPFDYWYRTNSTLRTFLEDRYRENIDLVEDSQLRSDCSLLFLKGNVWEKHLAISYLELLKELFYG